MLVLENHIPDIICSMTIGNIKNRILNNIPIPIDNHTQTHGLRFYFTHDACSIEGDTPGIIKTLAENEIIIRDSQRNRQGTITRYSKDIIIEPNILGRKVYIDQ